MKIKLSRKTLQTRITDDVPSYNTYVSPLINMANRYSRATRPKHLGQLSDLIRELKPRSLNDWRDRYLGAHPDAVEQAICRVVDKLQQIKEVLDGIDESTVRKWIDELVFDKTYVGLRIQDEILKEAAARLEVAYRPSTPDDESSGIDGYLGDQAVSVKPTSFRADPTHRDQIQVPIIWYDKKNGNVAADLEEVGQR